MSTSAPEGNTEKVDDYSQKSIGDINLVVVIPSPKLNEQQNSNIATVFGSSSQYQSI